ncbi:MAG: DNA repair protein RecN [Ruminococcus sp.]|nr:DNA repair protein RecN [Ruminococcus sp.]
MLKELYIQNFAVIEKATIDFTNDLNIFTGETGAGKSILINGINAILGMRVTKEIVRTGAEKAVVSALFVDLPLDVLAKLSELGLDIEDGQLFLSREISYDGGSSAKVNYRSVSISVLRELGNMLVNIHGQHDNQILMSPDKHIDILDSYADSAELLEDYQTSFRRLQHIAKEISSLKAMNEQRAYKADMLRDRIAEISALDIAPGEDEAIKEELDIAKNAVEISEALFAAEQLLSGSESTTGAVELVTEASKHLDDFTDIMTDLEELNDRLLAAKIEITDIAGELSSRLDKLNVDPKRFDYLNRRYEDLRKIMKKYGPELDNVFETLENDQKELEALDSADRSLDELNERKNELLTEVSKKARALSEHRRSAAERFIKQVTEELEFLNMPKVKLVVEINSGKLTISGMDNIEFLISANVGEEPRPIAKIASGGELSRIMLALKNVIAEKDSIGTLIFDEIDTGVSGRAALKIGMKLKSISRIRQVICVTHLAQIASMADNHLLIEKNIEGDRTVTTVKQLSEDERKYEIARIIGGENITELTLESAQELIDQSENPKND